MGRAPCCDKANVKKGPWSPEEDAKLKSYIEQHGTGGNWIALPQKIGLKRCGKSCRLRWLNYLRPNIKHGGFSEEEDNIICSLYISIGSRWSIIAAQLPGRTDNDIKNYWNTRLKKKLLLGSKQRSKEVIKKEDNRNGNILTMNNYNGGSGVSSTYWADQQSTILPTTNYPVNQSEHRVSGEHSSIRKLLMKLGGRFATDMTPFATSSSLPPMQQNYQASPIQPNFLMADDVVMSGCDEYSAKLEGLDCFYGFGNMMVGVDDINNGPTTSTTPTDVINWSEVSPLNYQVPCLFEEPGMQ